MNGIEIQTYSDQYKEKVIDLILSIQQGEFGIPIKRKDQPDLDNIPGFYQIGKGNFWIAFYGKTLVGSIALLDIGHGRGALRKMFVHEGYRGKTYGTGQELLNTLFDWARQQAFREIFLGTTEHFKAAQRFYEKNGFLELKKEALPATFPIMTVDVKFYRYILEQ